VAGCNDLPVVHNYGANRDIAMSKCGSGFGEGQLHSVIVGQRSSGTDGRGVHAEEVGFEPTVSCPTHTFQACRFGRFRTPPDEPLRSVSLPAASEHRAPRIVQSSDGVWQLSVALGRR
jgi:hypothetical protein